MKLMTYTALSDLLRVAAQHSGFDDERTQEAIAELQQLYHFLGHLSRRVYLMERVLELEPENQEPSHD